MKFIALTLLVFSVSSFASEVELSLKNPNTPLLLESATIDYPDRTDKVFIVGPWTRLHLNAVNKNRKTLIISSLTVLAINDVDGVEVNAETFFWPSPMPRIGVVKPQLDANCDGFVSSDEYINPSPGACPIGQYDILADSFFVYSLLNPTNRANLDKYKNANFYISVRLKGWFESFGEPTEDFNQNLVFQMRAQ